MRVSILLSILLLAPMAHSGVVFKGRMKQLKMGSTAEITTSLSEEGERVDTQSNFKGKSVKNSIICNVKKKTARMDGAGAPTKAMNDAQAKMKEMMAKMPADQRKKMEEMMSKHKTQQDDFLKSKSRADEAPIEKVPGSFKVAGFDTTKYTQKRGQNVMEFYVTSKPSPAAPTDAEIGATKACKEILASKSITGAQGLDLSTDTKYPWPKNHAIVKMVVPGIYEFEVLSMERKDLPSSLFD